MVDTPDIPGKMCDWENVYAIKYAEQALQYLSRTASIYIATAATQSTPEDIEKAFKRVELNKYINGYFCKHNTGYTKPAPEFYLSISKILSVHHSSITMVGDNLKKDILPCQKLGFNTIWLTSQQNEDVPDDVHIIANLGELCS
jgi:putative hydrolase of the HAD superfamily